MAVGRVGSPWLSDLAGTLYPLLHAWEAEGLLAWRERAENGRVLRCYRATALGRATLAEARAARTELAGELLPAISELASTARKGRQR